MRLKFNAVALGIAIAAAGASQSTAADMSVVAPKAPPPLFTVNDNSVSYAYRFNATDPFVTDHTGKSVVTFTHFDAWAYGTNFFNIDLLKSDINDPSAPAASTASRHGVAKAPRKSTDFSAAPWAGRSFSDSGSATF